ncbi:MAG TPA: hypothetical protein VGF31_09000 [Myxococcaceae bacterium]|jgi:hypothetical protein
MSGHDAVFEPLLGKRRTVRQALSQVAERWTRAPIEDPEVQASLENSVRHKILRGQVGGELPPGTDAAALAHAFVSGLVAGEGTGAVARVFRTG